jgi:acyl carrier protein
MRSRSSQRVPAVVDIVSAVFLEIQGTAAALDAPIASTGMDSIAMTELATVLAERVDTELPQTLLFDHPTIRTVATFVATTAPSEATVDTATEETRGLAPSAAKRVAAEAT